MEKKSRNHSFQTRRRAFAIWQKLGFFPWRKPLETGNKKKSGDFYRGAFDNIPFLNDDAKRTFVHLLLRPGYMIRDYINGQHSKYLAPLTALIIFYAFFGLVSALLKPYQERRLPLQTEYSIEEGQDSSVVGKKLLENTLEIVKRGYLLLHMDEFPEEVHTQRESALAALEATLRSQGIPLFIGEFLLLWLAMMAVMRKRKRQQTYHLSPSACAATSAYILCQFSFFMLFALLLSWGNSSKVGLALMAVLLAIDYRQLLDVSYGKALSLTVRTGIMFLVYLGLVFLTIGIAVVILAYFKG